MLFGDNLYHFSSTQKCTNQIDTISSEFNWKYEVHFWSERKCDLIELLCGNYLFARWWMIAHVFRLTNMYRSYTGMHVQWPFLGTRICLVSAAHHINFDTRIRWFKCVHDPRPAALLRKHWAFTHIPCVRYASRNCYLCIMISLWNNCVRNKMEIIVKTAMPKTKELWKLRRSREPRGYRMLSSTCTWRGWKTILHDLYRIQSSQPIYLNNFLVKSYRDIITARFYWEFIIWTETKGAQIQLIHSSVRIAYSSALRKRTEMNKKNKEKEI